jgi:hypothetical protein
MYAISADGTVAAGQATIGGQDHLVIWSQANGLEGTGLGGYANYTRGRGVGVDSTGKVHATGYAIGTGTGGRAFYWSGNLGSVSSGTYQDIPRLSGGNRNLARNLRVMSNDDVRVVGRSYKSDNKNHAFRWRKSDNNLLDLEAFTPTDDSFRETDAFGISNSGGRIAGYGDSDNAFHFTTANNQNMAIFDWRARSRGLSGDGNHVVGQTMDNGKAFMFERTGSGGSGHITGIMTELGNGCAWAASEDGSVVVGDNGTAYIWDATNGWRDLKTALINEYYIPAATLANWTLTRSTGISDDGLTITGYGELAGGSRHGWVAYIRVEPLEVDLDIFTDPADPNELTQNVGNKGRLPMAILGSEDYDVNDIDLTSLSIAGTVFPVKEPKIEKDENGDGILDLVIHFSRREVILALNLLDPPTAPGTVIPITVDGALLSGLPMFGTDNVTMVARGD